MNDQVRTVVRCICADMRHYVTPFDRRNSEATIILLDNYVNGILGIKKLRLSRSFSTRVAEGVFLAWGETFDDSYGVVRVGRGLGFCSKRQTVAKRTAPSS